MKANVLFFDRKPAAETPWTRELWVYDLRTNMHFTLKQNPLRLRAPRRTSSPPTRRTTAARAPSRSGSSGSRYDELVARDKASLDIIWLRDESLEDTENLPPPEVIAQEIVEDLEAALEFWCRRVTGADPSPARGGGGLKAQETTLQQLIQGEKQFLVPLYQRPYSWQTTQLEQLWQDIVEQAENLATNQGPATHFIGSVVLAPSADLQAAGVQRWVVVDGQNSG